MNGFKVKREDIRLLLQVIDPHGVNTRLRRRLKRRSYWSKGPNFCWHVDSYDKLKKYGLCINGCIDGYTRKLVWLRVGRSSNDPKVIGRYYLDAVTMHGGFPMFMRGDMGTENSLTAAMQDLLSRNEAFAHNSFIYGKSSFNTRIESWWCILRKECCQTWIEELKDLQNRGLFTGDRLDTNLLQFCFMKLLQNELDEVAHVWNAHYLQSTKEGGIRSCPSNVYLFPELFQVQDYICPVDVEVLELCRRECTIGNELPCDEEIFELGCIFMEEQNLDPPFNIVEGKELYINFRSWIMNM